MLQHTLSMLLSENSAHGVHVVYAKGRDFFFFCLALLLLLLSGNCFLVTGCTLGALSTQLWQLWVQGETNRRKTWSQKHSKNVTKQIKLPTDLKNFAGTKI